MSRDQYQDPYKKAVRELKEEHMNWNFEDFLQKAEARPETKIIPVTSVKSSFPKWCWMAAGIVLIFSVGLVFKYSLNGGIENQAKLVADEIQKQKAEFINENHQAAQQVAVHDADSASGIKNDSVFIENSIAEKDILDEILPKKSRMRKNIKPRFVQADGSGDSTGYKDSYVIVNGKKITSEKEAADVATFSFMKLESGFRETVASFNKDENCNGEY